MLVWPHTLMESSLRAVLVAVVTLCLVAQPARGDTPELEARRHFMAGTQALKAGEYNRAAEEYRLAYQFKNDPLIIYNIAQALRLAGDPAGAIHNYEWYLRERPQATQRAQIEEHLRALRAELLNQTTLPSPPPVMAPSEPASQSAVVVAAPPPARKPIYKRWWLWTTVGVVAVGVGLGLGLGLGLPRAPDAHFGGTRLSF
jgi:hypothetical protein